MKNRIWSLRDLENLIQTGVDALLESIVSDCEFVEIDIKRIMGYEIKIDPNREMVDQENIDMSIFLMTYCRKYSGGYRRSLG